MKPEKSEDLLKKFMEKEKSIEERVRRLVG
jgi:hypothetical protein